MTTLTKGFAEGMAAALLFVLPAFAGEPASPAAGTVDLTTKERGAVDFLAELLKPTYDPGKSDRSYEVVLAAVRRYAALNPTTVDRGHVDAVAKAVVEAVRGVNPDLVGLRDPVIREALRGAARSVPADRAGAEALRERSRAICLSIVRLKDPRAQLAASDQAFADELATEVMSSARAAVMRSVRAAAIRATVAQNPGVLPSPPSSAEPSVPTAVPPPPTFAPSPPEPIEPGNPDATPTTIQAPTTQPPPTAPPTTPPSPTATPIPPPPNTSPPSSTSAPVTRVTPQVSQALRDAIRGSETYTALEERPNGRPLTVEQRVEQLTEFLKSEEFRTLFSSQVQSQDPPTQAELDALKPMIEELARSGAKGGPIVGGGTVVTGSVADRLSDFLKIGHNELVEIKVNGKNLLRDERRKQLLAYLNDEGFLAEFREATGNADSIPSPADVNALTKIIDGLLDQPSTAPSSPNPPKTPSNSGKSKGQVAHQVVSVADDVSQILGGPSISQFTTLATDVYTLLGRPTLSSFGGWRPRFCPSRGRAVGYYRLD